MENHTGNGTENLKTYHVGRGNGDTMNIVETSIFDTHNIRKMCIVRNLYTRGNNEDYSRMLKFAADADVTMENLFAIADDIAKHSDLNAYGCCYEESVENFIYVLANDCVVRNFEIEW